MKWLKKGLIFAPDRNHDWMQTHASLPIADLIDPDTLRIYFGTRDGRGRSHIGYVEVIPSDPSIIRAVSDQPVLPLGELGTFDDSGIMPSWLVQGSAGKLLYYIGWNVRTTVPYHVAIGLAHERSGGFVKHSEGPVRDRSSEEPFFNTTPCVLLDNGTWRMWYASCTGWVVVGDRPEPRYRIHYAESKDAVRWAPAGVVSIDYDDFAQAIARPCVVKSAQGYRMFYSYRGIRGYRSEPNEAYRLGFAESADGIAWSRRDDDVGIDRSESGWDSQMVEYCSVYEFAGRTYMLYNGNGFGRSGFGYAVLDEGGTG